MHSSIIFKIFLFLLIKLISVTYSEEELTFSVNKCGTENKEIVVQVPSLFFPKRYFKNGNKTTGIRKIEKTHLGLKLIPFTLSCNLESRVVVTISLNDTSSAINNTSSPLVTFFGTGHLKYNRTYFQKDEYCLARASASELSIEICTQQHMKCTEETPCIRKCCEVDEVLDLSRFASKGTVKCRSSGAILWTPQFYQDRHTKVSSSQLEMIRPWYISHPPWKFCGNGDFTLMTLKKSGQDVSPFRILQDGSILEKISRTKWSTIPSSKICVDGAQNFLDESTGTFSGKFSGDEMETVLLDCRSLSLDNEEETGQYDEQWIYTPALLIAIMFLILTISVHLILWKKQTIRGWTLVGYLSFLTLEFICLIIARSMTEHGVICTASAIGIHFTALSTFSWLTAMNFDVWWSFRTMSPTVTKSGNVKQFVLYTIWATLLPTTIVTVALVLENIYGANPFSEVIVPEYGKSRCGLGSSAELPYFFGPISVLLGANLLFVLATLYDIYKNQRILKSKGIKTQILNDKAQFFGKLFIVAGITWIFDVVSWALTTSIDGPTPWYWMIVDLVNIFQAVAIFIIFVCNSKTITSLQKKLPFISKLLKLWPSLSFNKAGETTPNNDNNGGGNNSNRKLSITEVFSISEKNNAKNNLELI